MGPGQHPGRGTKPPPPPPPRPKMKLNVLTVFGGLCLALFSTICVLYFAGKKFVLSYNKMTFWPLVTFFQNLSFKIQKLYSRTLSN